MWFFQWIREQAKNAVLAGINDAAQELDGNGQDDSSKALLDLSHRLNPPVALPDLTEKKTNTNTKGKK